MKGLSRLCLQGKDRLDENFLGSTDRADFHILSLRTNPYQKNTSALSREQGQCV